MMKEVTSAVPASTSTWKMAMSLEQQVALNQKMNLGLEVTQIKMHLQHSQYDYLLI